jgi:Holliday junction resolvase-like predicted endonuclease
LKISFDFNDHKQLLIIIAFVICFIFGAYLYYKFNKFLAKNKMRKLRTRGAKGEDKAKKYLLKHGYKIIEEQPEHTAEIFINDSSYTYRVRADFLVESKGIKSIVEVKTGNKATDPTSTHTRRQLLEYSQIYNVDQFLFFDAETLSLHTIRFPDKQINITNQSIWRPLLFTFIVGVIIGAIMVYYLSHCL